jgi:C4-type Zn-finger protein
MTRIRKAVGNEQRDCPICVSRTLFTLYESFSRGRFGRHHEARTSAQCDLCGYRAIEQPPVTPAA